MCVPFTCTSSFLLRAPCFHDFYVLQNASSGHFWRNSNTMCTRDIARKNAQMGKLSLSLNYKKFFFSSLDDGNSRINVESTSCNRKSVRKKNLNGREFYWFYLDLWCYNTFCSTFCATIIIVSTMPNDDNETDERIKTIFPQMFVNSYTIHRHSKRFSHPEEPGWNVKQLALMNVCAQLRLSLIYLF